LQKSESNLYTRSAADTSDEEIEEKEEEPELDPLEIVCEYVEKVVKPIINKI